MAQQTGWACTPPSILPLLVTLFVRASCSIGTGVYSSVFDWTNLSMAFPSAVWAQISPNLPRIWWCRLSASPRRARPVHAQVQLLGHGMSLAGWLQAGSLPGTSQLGGGHISGDARLSARSSLPVALLLISSVSNAALQNHKWLLFFTGIIVNQHLVVHNTHALEFWLCFCQ